MSKDSCHTYIHSHASHHADLFEEFCHPPSASSSSAANNASGTATQGPGGNNANNNTGDPSMIHVPGHFLPFEEIHLPPYLMPVNPEDEDDVVPDMHAAFSIQRALHGTGGSSNAQGGADQPGGASGRGAQQEPIWRDLGLDSLMNANQGQDAGAGARREGKKPSVLMMR